MSLNTTNSLLDIPNLLPVKLAFDTRTSWDIIRSCLATLFACLWVSVHPNMPSPTHSDKRIFFTKVELMMWTLLFPEMIILWAFRQWRGARILSKKFKEYGWTMSHGFFVQMGGFVETGAVGSTRVLLADGLFTWMRTHERVPKVTAQQISGRSKGDGFSKAIVIAQTSWFVAQCIARHAKGLCITPAELSTLAYAVLNGVMYLLWWHKPLDCQTPVELHLSYPGSNLNRPFYLYLGSQASTPFTSQLSQFSGPLEFGVSLPAAEPELDTKLDPEPEENVDFSEPELKNIAPTTDPEVPVSATGTLTKLLSKRTRHYLREILFFPYRRLSNMRLSAWKRDLMFYAYIAPGLGIRQHILEGHVVLMFICLLFGGVHLLAWFSDFPSYPEHLFWRVCSVAMTALPMIYCLPVLLLTLEYDLRRTSESKLLTALNKLLTYNQFTIPPLYLIARLFLLIEIIIAFRNLPSSAFVNVTWTTYFPHV